MLDLFNIAKPQGCDIQTFYGSGVVNGAAQQFGWSKPRGVSHVYMMLIGAGGGPSSVDSYGGGSGAVTVWYGAAQHVPDTLRVYAGLGGIDGSGSPSFGVASSVYMLASSGPVLLLQANAGQYGTPGSAMTANYFAASGFFKSTAGQAGTTVGGAVTASATTFLSGGAYQGTTANYGYTAPSSGAGGSAHGRFQLQPIIVGVGGGGAVGTLSKAGFGGIGCGGGVQGSSGAGGQGGSGMVLIASW